MSSDQQQVLVVEDDAQIRNFIMYALRSNEYACVAAQNGRSAMDILLTERVDVVLLDLGLPDIDGVEVIKKVRQWSDMPIIVVSARDQDREKALALDSGADDYLTKPFSMTELLARIRVAVRHMRREEAGRDRSSATFELDRLKIDYEKRLVYLDGNELHMTPMEYNMLVLLSKNAGKVLTSGYIIRQIWGANYGEDTQALRALMANLRRKLEANPAKPRYILTEVGVGYRLVDE